MLLVGPNGVRTRVGWCWQPQPRRARVSPQVAGRVARSRVDRGRIGSLCVFECRRDGGRDVRRHDLDRGIQAHNPLARCASGGGVPRTSIARPRYRGARVDDLFRRGILGSRLYG